MASAPANTPGHRRRPKTDSTTNEIPVGGQTSVAKPATASISSPNLASAKYAAESATQPSTVPVQDRRIATLYRSGPRVSKSVPDFETAISEARRHAVRIAGMRAVHTSQRRHRRRRRAAGGRAGRSFARPARLLAGGIAGSGLHRRESAGADGHPQQRVPASAEE